MSERGEGAQPAGLSQCGSVWACEDGCVRGGSVWTRPRLSLSDASQEEQGVST